MLLELEKQYISIPYCSSIRSSKLIVIFKLITRLSASSSADSATAPDTGFLGNKGAKSISVDWLYRKEQFAAHLTLSIAGGGSHSS